MNRGKHTAGWSGLVLLCALGAGAGCTPCSSLDQAFDDLVQRHRGCDRDEECTVVGGNFGCHCSPSLGPCLGSPVNESARGEELEVLEELFEECRDEMGGVCDCGSIAEVACIEGECRATRVNHCMMADGGDPGPGDDGSADEPDGGVPDAANGGSDGG